MNAEILRSISFLKTLDGDELQKLSELFTTREVPADDKILDEGKPVHQFYLVCHGTVHARRTSQQREVLLGRIPPGGFFGEINLFDPGVATASIYAIDKVTVAVVEYDALRRFMENNPAIGYKIVSGLMAGMARRLRTTNERFANTFYWSSVAAQ